MVCFNFSLRLYLKSIQNIFIQNNLYPYIAPDFWSGSGLGWVTRKNQVIRFLICIHLYIKGVIKNASFDSL